MTLHRYQIHPFICRTQEHTILAMAISPFNIMVNVTYRPVSDCYIFILFSLLLFSSIVIANCVCVFVGSSSSDVLTSKDISASQSDITSIIHQTNQSMFYTCFFHWFHFLLNDTISICIIIIIIIICIVTVTITNGSNKSSGSSHREGLACSNGGNHDQEISGKYFFN